MNLLTRSRAVRIVLFPVLALTFLVGWALYVVGDAKGSTPKIPAKKAAPPKKQVDLEMGLLAEVEEEKIPAKN